MKPEFEAVVSNYVGMEDGDLFFFYRPKASSAFSVRDVDSLMIVMRPLAKEFYRLIRIEGREMPSEGNPFVPADVQRTGHKNKIILSELQSTWKQVEGSLVEDKAAARACGEGIYTLKCISGQVHFIYIMEIPSAPGKVQDDLGLRTQADYLMGIYNPLFEEESAGPRPNYPEPLRTRFTRDHVLYDFTPEFLDYPQTRFVLRWQNESPEKILGDMIPERESAESAEIFRFLKLRKEQNPVEPLFSGQWQ